jgi:Flp pilus assembly protein TadD
VSNYLAVLFIVSGSLFAQSGAGTVSVEELRNPLAGKSLKAILTAQQHLRSGERIQGLQELRLAMNDPIAMPYAISILGAEHIKSGEYDVATSELQQAVKLLPGKPENLSNLAYVLYLTGHNEAGVAEARKALQLDPGRPKTRLVLGLLLLRQGSHEAEAIAHIQAVTQEIPSAHLALAAHYERLGHAPEAEKERRAYSVTSNSLLATSK